MDLHRLQQQFYAAISSGMPASGDLSQAINQPLETLEQHLDVYRTNTLDSLQKALMQNYSVCKQLIGDVFFKTMAHAYARQYPSQVDNLMFYGENFPEFIASYEHAQSVPYLPEMARLESLWQNVFYGLNNERVNFEELAEAMQLYGDRIIFLTPSNSYLVVSKYPLHEIWKICQPGYEGDCRIDFENSPQIHLLLWQQNHEVRMELLTAAESAFIKIVQQRLPFSKMCAAFAEVSLEPVEELIPRLCQQGCINRFTFSEENSACT